MSVVVILFFEGESVEWKFLNFFAILVIRGWRCFILILSFSVLVSFLKFYELEVDVESFYFYVVGWSLDYILEGFLAGGGGDAEFLRVIGIFE